MTKHFIRVALALLLAAPLTANAQNKAIDFNPKMPFSDGFVAGNTLYVAGQQGPDDNGKVTGTTIEFQTERTIDAIKRIVEKAGFKMTDLVSVTVYITDLNDVPKMNEVYKRLMRTRSLREPLSRSLASSGPGGLPTPGTTTVQLEAQSRRPSRSQDRNSRPPPRLRKRPGAVGRVLKLAARD